MNLNDLIEKSKMSLTSELVPEYLKSGILQVKDLAHDRVNEVGYAMFLRSKKRNLSKDDKKYIDSFNIKSELFSLIFTYGYIQDKVVEWIKNATIDINQILPFEYVGSNHLNLNYLSDKNLKEVIPFIYEKVEGKNRTKLYRNVDSDVKDKCIAYSRKRGAIKSQKTRKENKNKPAIQKVKELKQEDPLYAKIKSGSTYWDNRIKIDGLSEARFNRLFDIWNNSPIEIRAKMLMVPHIEKRPDVIIDILQEIVDSNKLDLDTTYGGIQVSGPGYRSIDRNIEKFCERKSLSGKIPMEFIAYYVKTKLKDVPTMFSERKCIEIINRTGKNIEYVKKLMFTVAIKYKSTILKEMIRRIETAAVYEKIEEKAKNFDLYRVPLIEIFGEEKTKKLIVLIKNFSHNNSNYYSDEKSEAMENYMNYVKWILEDEHSEILCKLHIEMSKSSNATRYGSSINKKLAKSLADGIDTHNEDSDESI